MCTSLLSQLIIKTLKPVFTITCVSICFICFGQCLAFLAQLLIGTMSDENQNDYDVDRNCDNGDYGGEIFHQIMMTRSG